MVESLRQIAKVGREPLLKTERGHGGLMVASMSNPNSKFPCIAITSSDDIHYSERTLSTKCWQMRAGHPMLANESRPGPFCRCGTYTLPFACKLMLVCAGKIDFD